jgi:hypothetical protein
MKAAVVMHLDVKKKLRRSWLKARLFLYDSTPCQYGSERYVKIA